MTTPQPQTAAGLRLSEEQLTFLAFAVGTDALPGIGPRRPLTSLETSVAARSLFARGLLQEDGDDPIALTPLTAALLEPLTAPAPRLVCWLQHPTAGTVFAVRAAGTRVTMLSRVTADDAWYLTSVEGGLAAEGLRAGLARGLADPAASAGQWELGAVATNERSVHQGEILSVSVEPSGSLEIIEPDSSRRLGRRESVKAPDLERRFADLLAPLATGT